MISFEHTKDAIEQLKRISKETKTSDILEFITVLQSYNFEVKKSQSEYDCYCVCFFNPYKRCKETINVYSNGGFWTYSGHKGCWSNKKATKEQKEKYKLFREFVLKMFPLDKNGKISNLEDISEETYENCACTYFENDIEKCKFMFRTFQTYEKNDKFQKLKLGQYIKNSVLRANTIAYLTKFKDTYTFKFEDIKKIKCYRLWKQITALAKKDGQEIYKKDTFYKECENMLILIYGIQTGELSPLNKNDIYAPIVYKLHVEETNDGPTSVIDEFAWRKLNDCKQFIPPQLNKNNLITTYAQKILLEGITYMSFINAHCNLQNKNISSAYNSTIRTLMSVLNNIGSEKEIHFKDCCIDKSKIKNDNILEQKRHLCSWYVDFKKKKVA